MASFSFQRCYVLSQLHLQKKCIDISIRSSTKCKDCFVNISYKTPTAQSFTHITTIPCNTKTPERIEFDASIQKIDLKFQTNNVCGCKCVDIRFGSDCCGDNINLQATINPTHIPLLGNLTIPIDILLNGTIPPNIVGQSTPFHVTITNLYGGPPITIDSSVMWPSSLNLTNFPLTSFTPAFFGNFFNGCGVYEIDIVLKISDICVIPLIVKPTLCVLLNKKAGPTSGGSYEGRLRGRTLGNWVGAIINGAPPSLTPRGIASSTNIWTTEQTYDVEWNYNYSNSGNTGIMTFSRSCASNTSPTIPFGGPVGCAGNNILNSSNYPQGSGSTFTNLPLSSTLKTIGGLKIDLQSRLPGTATYFSDIEITVDNQPPQSFPNFNSVGSTFSSPTQAVARDFIIDCAYPATNKVNNINLKGKLRFEFTFPLVAYSESLRISLFVYEKDLCDTPTPRNGFLDIIEYEGTPEPPGEIEEGEFDDRILDEGGGIVQEVQIIEA
jgi:hypothetical protein